MPPTTRDMQFVAALREALGEVPYAAVLGGARRLYTPADGQLVSSQDSFYGILREGRLVRSADRDKPCNIGQPAGSGRVLVWRLGRK